MDNDERLGINRYFTYTEVLDNLPQTLDYYERLETSSAMTNETK